MSTCVYIYTHVCVCVCVYRYRYMILLPFDIESHYIALAGLELLEIHLPLLQSVALKGLSYHVWPEVLPLRKR